MKALFPKLVDVEEWKDSYTGKIHKSSPGIKAESLRESISTSAVERRSLFLNGTEKPRKPDSEEGKEAELILPHRTGLTFQKALGARQFFGQSPLASEGTNQALIDTPFPEAPIRNVPVKQESLTKERELRASGEGIKKPKQEGLGAKLKVRDAVPETLIRNTKQADHQASQLTKEQDTREKNDLNSNRAVQSYTAVQVQSKIDMRGSSQIAKDIILDILMDGRGKANVSKEALQGLQDVALKMIMPITETVPQKSLDFITQASSKGYEGRQDPSMENKKEVQKHFDVTSGAKGEHNFGEKEEKFLLDAFHGNHAKGKRTLDMFQKAKNAAHASQKQESLEVDKTRDFLTSDVQKAAKTSVYTNWKEDAEEQLRIGTWAVHVLAGHMESQPSELLRGMKPDAIKALGRVSLLILSASSKSAQAQSQPLLKSEILGERSGTHYSTEQRQGEDSHENFSVQKEDGMINEREVENFGMISKGAIKGSNDYFRMEAIQSDLQALQNNLSLDFTADMLVEGFVEALKYDALENNVDARTDILTSTKNASQTSRKEHSKSLDQQGRTQQVSFDVASAFISSETPRHKIESNVSAPQSLVVDLGISAHTQIQASAQSRHKDLGFHQNTANEQESEGAWLNIPQSKYKE